MKNLENKQNELKNFLNNIEIKLEDFQKDFQYYYNQCSVADQKFEKLQIDYIFVAGKQYNYCYLLSTLQYYYEFIFL